MRKLCCAGRSNSIAMIYIIAVPDMHGQKVDTSWQSHLVGFAKSFKEMSARFD
jgi:hypothetical protein